jgi:hypothetical protein
MAEAMACPWGDALCPCQDGDACHYAGTSPMTCPRCRSYHLLAEPCLPRNRSRNRAPATVAWLREQYPDPPAADR